ncbi:MULTISPECIES: magnesium-translocating P-type ATPase [Elizabethkingia]|uniref:magnesium-translocating P-type ATPase n=1 Tax=Elizabethkingia TaxID=308865 RepID=UPI00073986C8|nr:MULTISPECIES: magnesium-translocating P-type ATPase [Elizabethkingia]KUF42217.1 magnesium-translocating P-type ATPase [Elizabethkingia anophelis]MCT3645990.1 magnesium-translocating P-type ATPase [Elizabethkingia anophelis]MCT3657171.1 magnesium-translocating P-type ATPase [Elizabethkingia anophelis]MCT3678869.1 magnesium-translocating P-type ATPase [Elizabethkingia anophelis]MCT3686302.1 magnesium-translocating P-type ATPase [Elizabethkingia anophelis]
MLKRSTNKNLNSAALVKLKEAAVLNEKMVYAMLETSEEGLSDNTVKDRVKIYGKNEIATQKAPSWLKQFAHSFFNPFNYILACIAIISLFIDAILVPSEEKDFSTCIIIAIMLLFSTILRFIQEFRSNKAAEALKKMVKTSCLTKRKFKDSEEIEIADIVPGDIILLSAGDMVPADCRILKSKDLFISESILTGEALPVEKNAFAIKNAKEQNPLTLRNICFMGTNVVSGSATVVVANTGIFTYFGSISRNLVSKRPETSFDIGVNKVSFLLIQFMLVMTPVIFLINGFVKDDWMQALLFAIAVAVGLTPEMLPMIVTANLAKGAVNMSKKKVIVKRLNAIQNIGAMDILCTDKTGTLTLDKIVLETHLNVRGTDDDEVLKWAYLNSFHQTGLKNLLDQAVLDHAEVHNLMKADELYMKVDEIPFDFERRRMSVVLNTSKGKHLMISKGAVEEMLSLCKYALDPGDDHSLHIENDNIVPLDEAMKQKILKMSEKLNAEGLRVLLVAIREFEGNHPLNYSVADENNLTLTGFIGFLDPAKPSAEPSIKALHKLGVEVKVITGDNDIVAKKICHDVGIPINNIMLGEELDHISDEELSRNTDLYSIFAKVSPLQKQRIVKVLKSKGHTVGFMGDGINDAAAIKEADVGISVDTGADIAKESADIILLEKDLMVLRSGVIYGRRTFGNIIKYIKMTASSNFGNMFSMIGASAFLPFLPMLPLQILTQNLLYDVSQSSIPWDTMDKDFLEKPKKWDASSIKKFMLYIGPLSSIFDYITFAVMFFIFKANTPEHQSLFQTGWFVEGLLSQTLIVHIIRTKKIPFIQSWAAAPVVALTSLIMLIGLSIPFTPIAGYLKMQPLPLSYFPYLLAILTGYCILTQLVKQWFIKKFQQWL